MARVRRGDPVDGVLLLDKPSGITSNSALQAARRLLGAAKAGHTGTLDPLASGLLPLAFGEATKFAADLLDASKAYRARLDLGVTTTTGDTDGDVVAQAPVDVSHERLAAELARWVGTVSQVPPMHSALKRDGRPLYAYARAGVQLERTPRAVTIHRLELVSFDGRSAEVDVDCSKGTYVRVLAEDIGRALGCGACLGALRRLRVGTLNLAGALTLEQLHSLAPAERLRLLLPLDTLLATLPRIELDDGLAERFRHGQRLQLDPGSPRGQVRVVDPRARLLGVASIDEHGTLAPRRLLNHDRDRQDSP